MQLVRFDLELLVVVSAQSPDRVGFCMQMQRLWTAHGRVFRYGQVHDGQVYDLSRIRGL